MPFDYKKEYKEFYLPPKKPQIITVPAMNFVAVQGKGDPNDPAGEYKAALELLYGIAFTIKMSCSCNSMQFWCTTFSKCVILYGMNNSEGNR